VAPRTGLPTAEGEESIMGVLAGSLGSVCGHQRAPGHWLTLTFEACYVTATTTPILSVLVFVFNCNPFGRNVGTHGHQNIPVSRKDSGSLWEYRQLRRTRRDSSSLGSLIKRSFSAWKVIVTLSYLQETLMGWASLLSLEDFKRLGFIGWEKVGFSFMRFGVKTRLV